MSQPHSAPLTSPGSVCILIITTPWTFEFAEKTNEKEEVEAAKELFPNICVKKRKKCPVQIINMSSHKIQWRSEEIRKTVSKIRNPSHTSQPLPEPDRHCDATTESLESLHGQEKEASARWG